MIRLLQVELKKTFKNKSIYIIWGLMLIFCLLNNILYYTDYDEYGNYKYLEQENLKEEKKKLEEEIQKYSKDNYQEVTMYITIKTKLEILNLKQKFKENSWQYNQITNYLYDTIYQINYYEYVEENKEELTRKKEEYIETLSKLNENNYKYFLIKELEDKTNTKNTLKEQLLLETDKLVKLELQEKITNIEFDEKILNYRLNYEIKQDNSYLNTALENYQENYKTIKYYNNLNQINTYQDKINYQKAISAVQISKYIIENKQNVNKENNLNYQLRTIIEDYELFIVILTLIISSSIICNEFKDGTIKLLLIKPYSRGKILLSKYFTTTIVISISILLLIIMELTIGGFVFGFSSLKTPVIVYNFNTSKIIEYSVFQYMIIRILFKIPFILMLITISIFLSVITSSNIISITMPLMLYMFTPTFIYLIKQSKLEFMKYLVNINWNLHEYLFGQLPELSFINLQFSILILTIYFIILWILTFTIFQKKNIKNT